MDLLRHMVGLFYKLKSDPDIRPHQISLLLALVYKWNKGRRISPFAINREELMSISKIGSEGTYSRCLKQLHGKYIAYYPGGDNGRRPAFVSLFYLGTNETGDNSGAYADVELEPSSSTTESIMTSEMEPSLKEKDFNKKKDKYFFNEKNTGNKEKYAGESKFRHNASTKKTRYDENPGSNPNYGEPL